MGVKLRYLRSLIVGDDNEQSHDNNIMGEKGFLFYYLDLTSYMVGSETRRH